MMDNVQNMHIFFYLSRLLMLIRLNLLNNFKAKWMCFDIISQRH